MTLDQIAEYISGWSDDGKKKNNNDIINPTLQELELFNLTSGISRVKVPKK